MRAVEVDGGAECQGMGVPSGSWKRQESRFSSGGSRHEPGPAPTSLSASETCVNLLTSRTVR